MTDQDLARRLKRLRRTVDMLQTELRREHLDEGLIEDLDAQLEDGIAAERRSSGLRDRVDALRENLMTPRPEIYADASRACDKLRDAIQDIMARLDV